MKILLIQSKETQNNGSKEHLEARGYKVISAGSGLSALMLARNMSIDVIVLDVALPDIEGMDLCRLFRKRQETHDVPIILITTRGYLPQKLSGGIQGPDGFLEKPYTEADLDGKIRSMLSAQTRRARLRPVQAEQIPLPVTGKSAQSAGAASDHEHPIIPKASQSKPAEVRLNTTATAPQSHANPDENTHRVSQSQPLSTNSRTRQKQPQRLPDQETVPEALHKWLSAASSGVKADPGRPILPFHGEGSAVVDPDTGLFGKAQFEAMLDKEFKRAVRFKQSMSLMLINLDGRTRGQTADEALVKAMITLVQKTIREVDTAAWWSGESFIVLLPNTTATDALQAAARTLEAVALHPFSWPDASRVTMNIGVAGLPNLGIMTQVQLIDSAQAAMHRARDLMTPPPFDIRSKRR